MGPRLLMLSAGAHFFGLLWPAPEVYYILCSRLPLACIMVVVVLDERDPI